MSLIGEGATSIEIREVSLPLQRPYRSGSTSIAARSMLLLRIGAGGLSGWGECAPMPGYSEESLEACRRWLCRLAESMIGTSPPPGAGPAAARFAAETAGADLEARRLAQPLWLRLGADRDRVEVGAVIGADVADGDLPGVAEGLAADGYRRIKLKVTPDTALKRAAALRRALPDHDLAVDANGSFDPGDPLLPLRLDALGLSFIEQPFPAAAWRAHTVLSARAETPICLDESIDGVPAVNRALDSGAASIINVKPARLGGLAAAREVHDAARDRGAPVWCGGMVEGGVGKAAALTVAALPGMALPADLPPSRRHFAEDLVIPPWEMSDGCLHLRPGPGLGAVPDPVLLDRHTVGLARFGDVG